jgi:hypothetical protein
MDKNLILLSNGLLGRYPVLAMQIAEKNGWDSRPHVAALRSLKNSDRNVSYHQDLVATTHPANWLTEAQFVKYFG